MSEHGHIPVLPTQVVDLLSPEPGDTVIDCTAGLGGHAALLAERVGVSGTVVLCDLDAGNLQHAAARLAALPAAPKLVTFRGNFAAAPRFVAEQGLRAGVVLADLGFASTQVDSPARGLSFSRPGPLDMRLDPTGRLTAAELVNSWNEAELRQVIKDFGEERHAGLVARRICEARREARIETTDQLATIVRDVLRRASGGGGGGGGHTIDPATRTFQAIRIAVNDELGNLEALLDAIQTGARSLARGAGGVHSWLAPGARIGSISFHSLEDRRVKQAFGTMVDDGLAESLTRKPVVADDAECSENPRSRSAKLRVIRVGASA